MRVFYRYLLSSDSYQNWIKNLFFSTLIWKYQLWHSNFLLKLVKEIGFLINVNRDFPHKFIFILLCKEQVRTRFKAVAISVNIISTSFRNIKSYIRFCDFVFISNVLLCFCFVGGILFHV